ncbi:MAG: glycosyltransferase, partial [Nitrososphaerales archaeon]
IRDPSPDYLRKCLESIFSQTYENFELIVVFDHSGTRNDKLTLAVLEEYTDDHRLKIIRSPTATGRAGSMNQGLLNSRGDFIAVLDGDDYCVPNRLSEQVDYMTANNFGLIGSWAYAIDENDRMLGIFKPPTHYSTIRKYFLLHNPFWHSTIMFRREVIEKIGLYNPEFDGAEDYEIYIRAVASGYRVSNIPKFLVYYRVRSGSASRRSTWRRDRYAYLRAKRDAILKLHYRTARDLFYFTLSPIALLVSPKHAFDAVASLGWYVRLRKPRDKLSENYSLLHVMKKG